MIQRKPLILACAAVLLALAPLALLSQQAAPPPGAAAPGRGMMGAAAGPPSPEIHSDNTVTFRLMAPKASEVVLNGDWPGGMNVAMTKDEQGVWSVTVGPLKPELWGYTFSVDGVRTLDPRNGNVKRDGVRFDNILLISGPESSLYEVNDVPHGTVSMVWYDSPTLKLTRRMYVYTPPGYAQANRRYPVLYLLHGGGGDEDAWYTLGRTNYILDNLIAQGKAVPMIVVMPNGNANQKMASGSGPVPGQTAGRGAAPPAAAPSAAPAAAPGRQGAAAAPMASPFPESLVKDIIPFVDKHYRTIPNKDNRAIAGLSMGGGHTLTATNTFPGTFGYIGVWSAGVRQPNDAIVKQLSAVKAAGVRLYYVGCGVDDKLAYEGSKTLVSLLKQAGIEPTFRESSGGHTWFNWRIYLSEFAPMLFRSR
jgi:enterochelin esterase family protein